MFASLAASAYLDRLQEQGEGGKSTDTHEGISVGPGIPEAGTNR